MTYYHDHRLTKYPVTVGLLRSLRWRLGRMRMYGWVRVIVLVCVGMAWWIYASLVLCAVVFTFPVEAIVNHGKPPQPVAIRQPGSSSPSAMMNARANYTRAEAAKLHAQTEAVRAHPAWCSHCNGYSPGTAAKCVHCGASSLTYYTGV